MKRPEVTSLYKYRSFDESSIQCLLENCAWFSDVSLFNDPFGCGIQIDDRRIKEAVIHAVKMADQKKGISTDNMRTEKFVVRPSDIEAFNTFKNSVSNLIRNMGILCLSEVCDDLLMWAHYADCHTGFCVEYERDPGNILGQDANQVHYQVKLPSFIPHELTLEGGELSELWLTKSNHWSYEKEWRVLAWEGGGKLYNFRCKIKSVIFGLRMAEENRMEMVSVLSDKGIEFKEAVRDSYEFKLNIIDYKG